jgi:predicted permease
MLDRLTRWWRRTRRREDDFRAEVRSHLDLETDRLVAEGWTPDAARMEARRRFGNAAAATEAYHDARTVGWIEDAARDVAYGLRLLRKDRAYALAATAALALGIGGNVTLFSIFSAVALAPMQGVRPDRLMSVYAVSRSAIFGTFSYGDYVDMRDHATTLASLAAQQADHLRLTGVSVGGDASDGPAEPVVGLYVSANYFDTYGVHPTVGRALVSDDERVTAAPFAALISDSYWERRFQRNPAVLGSHAVLSGTPVVIVGITPRGFMGTRQEIPDFWVTMAALGDVSRRALDRTTLCCELTARLADGATPELATAELRVLNDRAQQSDQLVPSDRRTVRLSRARPFANYAELWRRLFVVLQATMALVLLIACANVATLLLGRAAAREREIAVRLALGARRRRLVRQLVTEGVVLSLLSGASALAVTWYGLTVGARYASAMLARQGGGTFFLALTPNATLLAYAVLMSVAAGLLFALAPALQATRRDVSHALRDGSAGAGLSRRSRLRGALVVGQVAVSLALLLDAGLLSLASWRVLQTEPGFAHRDVLSMWVIDPREVGYDSARASAIVGQLEERVRALPGVRRVAVTSRMPLGGNVAMSVASPAPDPAPDAPRLPYEYVSEDYFQTISLTLRGRAFTHAEVESRAPVVVVSDSLARTLWPGENAIGKQLFFGSHADATRRQFTAALSGSARVIGVVSDMRSLSLVSKDPGAFYLPGRTNLWSSRLLIAIAGDQAPLRRGIALASRAIAPTVPVSVESLDDVIAADAAHVTTEIAAAVLGIVGLLGLALASVGIYGTVAYSVRQQRREIGIRMALGARRVDVIAHFIRGLASSVGIGSAIGLAIGLAGAKGVEAVLDLGMLGGIINPAAIACVVAGVVLIALLAGFASARRATHLDPAEVLQAA